MKIARLAMGVAVIGALVVTTVRAQGLQQPASVTQVGFNNDRFVADQALRDAAVSDADESLVADCGESSCGKCRRCCSLGDPCTLPQPCALQRRGITLSGWFSSGIYGNAHGAGTNGPLGFNDVGDGYTVNQLWLALDKPTDTGGYGVDWGGHVDYVFGVDGPDTQAFGDEDWDYGWNSARDYGSAIPQAYVELAINDWTIKGGHFYTIIGWEVVQAPDNFFYTHSYTMYYAEPFNHTGILASYKLNDNVTAHGGWTAGWDSGWGNRNGASTFLGGVALTLSEDASLTWACNTGTQGNAGGVIRGDVYMNSIVFEYALTDKFTYILQHDLGSVSGAGATPSQWFGINQYFQYQLNDCWAAGMRVEWFRDDDGARVPIDAQLNGNPGDYYGITWGLNYRPHANVMLRPEIRYDWFDGLNPNGLPFDNGQSNEQFSGGFDVIVTF